MLLELNSALERKNQFPPAASRKEGRKEGQKKEEKNLQQQTNKQTNEIEEYLERRSI
jgi:hypothetical protein